MQCTMIQVECVKCLTGYNWLLKELGVGSTGVRWPGSLASQTLACETIGGDALDLS